MTLQRSQRRRPRVGADLHVHSTHSDGACTPLELVRSAASVGLAALAITDHDTLSAILPARDEARRVGIELVAGVELTAERDGREIHLLGYFIDPTDAALNAATDQLRRARAERFEALTIRLISLGLRVDGDHLRQTYPRATLGRKHLADYLVVTGQAPSYRVAFERWLGDEGPASVPKPRLDWREAIGLIRGAGGVAGWAHPPYNLRFETLQSLTEAGLGAVEVRGPKTDAAVTRRWQGWAETLGLVPTAGTDFHAPDRPGRWVGAIQTADADLDRLRLVAAAQAPSRTLAATAFPLPPLPPSAEANHGVQGSV